MVCLNRPYSISLKAVSTNFTWSIIEYFVSYAWPHELTWEASSWSQFPFLCIYHLQIPQNDKTMASLKPLPDLSLPDFA